MRLNTLFLLMAFVLSHELIHLGCLLALGVPVYGFSFFLIHFNAPRTAHWFAIYHGTIANSFGVIFVYAAPLILIPLYVLFTKNKKWFLAFFWSYADFLIILEVIV